VKTALQTSGLVPHARKRRPLPGMLVHSDASRHAWLPDAQQDLVSVSDDATNEVYYAALVPEEDTRTVLAERRQIDPVLPQFGIVPVVFISPVPSQLPSHVRAGSTMSVDSVSWRP
jgi:hypothetical protein